MRLRSSEAVSSALNQHISSVELSASTVARLARGLTSESVPLRGGAIDSRFLTEYVLGGSLAFCVTAWLDERSSEGVGCLWRKLLN